MSKFHKTLSIQLSLLFFTTAFFFQCSPEDEITQDFKYIDNVFASHQITERELGIIEDCQQTLISDSTTLSQHVIGTWRLVGFSSNVPFFLPEYSYQQIAFGPSPGFGLMEFLSPAGLILNQIPFTWSAAPNAGDSNSTIPGGRIISEPYIHDVVGLRFCEEYAFISFIDRNSKLIFQKQ